MNYNFVRREALNMYFVIGFTTSLGIITGILGAPYLLLMLFRMNHKGG